MDYDLFMYEYLNYFTLYLLGQSTGLCTWW